MITVSTVRKRSPLNPKITHVLQEVVKLPEKPRYANDKFVEYLSRAAADALAEIAVQAVEKMEDGTI